MAIKIKTDCFDSCDEDPFFIQRKAYLPGK